MAELARQGGPSEYGRWRESAPGRLYLVDLAPNIEAARLDGAALTAYAPD